MRRIFEVDDDTDENNVTFGNAQFVATNINKLNRFYIKLAKSEKTNSYYYVIYVGKLKKRRDGEYRISTSTKLFTISINQVSFKGLPATPKNIGRRYYIKVSSEPIKKMILSGDSAKFTIGKHLLKKALINSNL